MSTTNTRRAVEAHELGVYWAAGMAEFAVTMDDGSKRAVMVPITPDAERVAMAKTEQDAQGEPKTVTRGDIMRVTAVYEYELEPDLERRGLYYGTTDPAECAKVDAGTDDLMMLISDADMKSFTIEPVTTGEPEKAAT